MSENPPSGYTLADLGKGYSEAFGPVFIDRSGARMAFRVAERHANPIDTCHGGAPATFADAMIAAVHAGAGSGQAPTPTNRLERLRVGKGGVRTCRALVFASH